MLPSHQWIAVDPDLTGFGWTTGQGGGMSINPSDGPSAPGQDVECKNCTPSNGMLLYGSGMGKSGTTASYAEIKECLKKVPVRRPYNLLVYNCRDWTVDAEGACGLDCSSGPSFPLTSGGPGNYPTRPMR